MRRAGPNRLVLGQARAHKLVLAAMRALPGEAMVQGNACTALGNMAYNNGRVFRGRAVVSHACVQAVAGLRCLVWHRVMDHTGMLCWLQMPTRPCWGGAKELSM